MKNVMLLFALLFLTGRLYSQITIDNVPINSNSDTLVYLSAAGTAISVPTGATSWDYSGLPSGTIIPVNYYTSPNSNFPEALFHDSLSGEVLNSAYVIYYNNFFAKSATGYNIIGTETPEHHYSMSMLTGNSLDSLIVKDESHIYDTPYPIIHFPLTYNYSATTNVTRLAGFYITVTAYALNDTKVTKKTFITVNDTVVGYGKLKLPSYIGDGIDALLLQRQVTTLDSFYMGGAPAPTTLVNAFGIAQGKQAISYNYYFFSNNTKSYLLKAGMGVNFTTVNYIYYLMNIPSLTDIDESASETNTEIKLFPNPTIDGTLTFEFANPAMNQQTLKILNTFGMEISEYTVEANASSIKITLPKDISKGVYFYTLNSISGKFIVR